MLIGIFLWSLAVFGQKLILPPDELDVKGYNESPDTTFYYYPVSLFFSKLMFPACGMAIFTFLYFSLIFPRQQVTPRELKIVKYTIAFLYLCLTPIIFFTDLVVPELIVYWAGYGVYSPGLLALFYGIGCAFLLITVLVLFSSYRKSDGLEKKQIKNILYGGGATLILFLLTGLLPAFLVNFGIRILPRGIPLGPTVVLPFVIMVLYSILKFRLFDVQLAIRNGLITNISAGVAFSILGIVIFIPYYVYTVDTEIIIFSAFGVFIFLFIIQNSIKNISTRIVEFFIPSLKWKECKTKEIHLISYPSGVRVTSLVSENGSHLDPDIVSGMLTSVKHFVEDSFHAQDRETIRSLTVGDTKLIIEHSPNAFIVVVFTGFESQELRTDCQKVLTEVEEQYGAYLEDWDGNLETIKGVNKLVAKLLPT
ncbi:MAG: hypothetical protein JSV49_09310 [Thermoplasmata archaeon]|nr:MAG: hypothetical protein JSV49_09310 [Thermoplasmata archaeon]